MQIISAPSGVKSVQRGTASMSGVGAVDVAVSAVNMGKALLTFSVGAAGSSTINSLAVRGKLTTSSNIQFNRNDTTGGVAIDWELIEYA